MKVGANKRNIAILSVLAVVGVYVLWTNVFSSSGSEDAPKAVVSHAPAPAVHTTVPATDITQRRREGQNRSSEWNPPYKTGLAIDPVKVDPTLRLDLLAKVQNVEIEADAQRNLFQFGAAPPPVDKTPLPAVPKILTANKHPMGPQPPPGPPPPAPTPTAPPITLKYYGFANPRASGHKRAFFLDNDDIIVASEGELIKRRYKLVKIGVNSVTMEDTQFKSEQTLPLAPDATS
jgi:hypothetical protein